MVLAASAAMSGAAQPVLDVSAASQHQLRTNPAVNVSFYGNLNTTPNIGLGSDLLATGLFVDMLKPQPTWNLFNASVPAGGLINPMLVVSPPAAASHPNDDLAVHEPSLVFLKLSFP